MSPGIKSRRGFWYDFKDVNIYGIHPETRFGGDELLDFLYTALLD
jgi:hypothetical protein